MCCGACASAMGKSKTSKEPVSSSSDESDDLLDDTPPKHAKRDRSDDEDEAAKKSVEEEVKGVEDDEEEKPKVPEPWFVPPSKLLAMPSKPASKSASYDAQADEDIELRLFTFPLNVCVHQPHYNHTAVTVYERERDETM